MKKLILLGAIALAACKANTAPTTENAADAMEANLTARAAALDADTNAEANRAAAAAMAEANVQAQAMGNRADAIRATLANQQ